MELNYDVNTKQNIERKMEELHLTNEQKRELKDLHLWFKNRDKQATPQGGESARDLKYEWENVQMWRFYLEVFGNDDTDSESD